MKIILMVEPLSTTQNQETVVKVHQLVARDCYMTLKLRENQPLSLHLQFSRWVHSATTVKHFLPNCSTTEIAHHSYSNNLTSANFILFPELKTALRGRWFLHIKNIKKNLTSNFYILLPLLFYEGFRKM